MTKYKSVKSLKSLHFLANVFSVAPIYDFDKNKAVESTLHKFYGVFACIVTASFATYCLTGRISTMYKQVNAPTILIDAMSLIIVTITNVVLTFTLNTTESKRFQKFIHLLLNFDTKSEISILDKMECGYYKKFICYHAIHFVFCFCDASFWLTKVDFIECLYFSNRYFQYYQLLTFSFLIYNYIVLIRDRFTHMNDCLIYYVSNSVHAYVLPREFNRVKNNDNMKCKNVEYCLKKIISLYTCLNDIVKLFNKIFGKILLLMTVTIVTGLLVPLNNIIAVLRNNSTYYPIQGAHIHFFISCGLWASVFLVSKNY